MTPGTHIYITNGKNRTQRAEYLRDEGNYIVVRKFDGYEKGWSKPTKIIKAEVLREAGPMRMPKAPE